MNLMNLKPPSKGESTFLFWTAILMAVVVGIVVVLAIIRIFTHKSVVYEEPPKVIAKPTTAVIPVVTTTAPLAPAPVRISNIPGFSNDVRPTNLSTSFSDVPITYQQRSTLEQELVSLQGALSD